MRIKSAQIIKKYMRTIEGMGEGLVLFKTSIVEKRIGQNFHLFFEDGRKPPLDIAINPDCGTIEYISYFAQDEKIVVCDLKTEIEYKDGLVVIENEFFDKENTSISIEKNFELIKKNNDILILQKDKINEKKLAYRIDDMNYLLFCSDFDFCGILLKNISAQELKEIQNSQCI